MKNGPYPYYEMPQISSLADLVDQKAASVPDKVAFTFWAKKDTLKKVTCAEFAADVKRAAAWTEKQYGRGNHIAIIGPNSYEYIVALLAAVTSGNVAVPIDKELPENEVRVLLERAEITISYVAKTYMDLVENVEGMRATSQKKLMDLSASEDGEYSFVVPEDHDLAIIIFTSGTSGQSKGVMLSHGNITSQINGFLKLFKPNGTKTLAVLPFHHAFGLVPAIFGAFHLECDIFINKSLKTVQKDIKEAKPDIILMVPLFIETFYKQIMINVRKTGKEKKLKRGIRVSNLLRKIGIDKRRSFFKEVLDAFGGDLTQIISGGAYLDEFYIKQFDCFGVDILNGYGTSECAPVVSVNRNNFKKKGSVGQLVPGLEAKTSDEGEVLVKGSSVMLGYYNNPEETQKSLTDGWYHTGDLGYVDEDNFIYLTGRAKNLIILSNGENISPEEIENDYMRDEAVCEVLVYDLKNKIIAEIYPEEEYRGNQEYFRELTDKVNNGRPAYKQVASFRLRDEEFIKNSSKKIVRYKNIPKE